MPELITFIPCQQVIIDTRRNLVSTVNVLEEVTVDLPPGAVFDEKAAVPLSWELLTRWEKANGDSATYEQQVNLLAPDGTLLESTATEFSLSDWSVRLIAVMSVFPAWLAGVYRLQVAFRLAGTKDPWTVASNYPIVVKHVASSDDLPQG